MKYFSIGVDYSSNKASECYQGIYKGDPGYTKEMDRLTQ